MPFLWEFFLLQGGLTHRARRAQRKNRGSWRLCAKLHWRCAIRSWDIGLYNHVIKPHKQRCSHTDSCECPPHLGGALHNFAVIMHQAPAEPSPHERSDADREKRKTHVGSLLSRRSQARNVLIVARRKHNLAQCNDENGKHDGPHGWM